MSDAPARACATVARCTRAGAGICGHLVRRDVHLARSDGPSDGASFGDVRGHGGRGSGVEDIDLRIRRRCQY